MRTTAPVVLLLAMLACSNGKEALYSGTIEVDQVRVSPRVGGTVEALLVGRGDLVEEGELLVRIDDTEPQLAVRQAGAAVDAAQAGLATMLEGARRQEISSAASAAEAALAAEQQAEADLERARELYDAGAISDLALQSAETGAVQAASARSRALQAYSMTLEGARSTEIDAATAALEAAEASLDLALARLQWTEVRSPLSGLVTDTAVLPGENVSPGITLLTVSDTDTVKAVFYVSEPDLALLSPGLTVEVSTGTGDGGTVTGVMAWISDRAEFTPSRVETREERTSLVYRAEAVLPNPGGLFKAGMPVDVRVAGPR
jgi:HlyD family secretion protein